MEAPTIKVEVKYEYGFKVISRGQWKRGIECSKCGYVQLAPVVNQCPPVCGICGELPAVWYYVPVRWVRYKTGFWPWQNEGYYQKRKV